MKFPSWHVAQENSAAAERLADAGYPYLVSGVLASRGVECAEDAAEFLTQETSLTYSPFLMRDMDKAVERIAQAVAAGERIAIFGDYDVDGITATCIMVDYLKSRGADVLHYIPRRIEDGYGLSRDAIEGLRKGGATLLVTVDCGITGVEEVAFARSIGMDVVVTDHHECKETLPVACAVVDPRRGDCEYPFKHLAGCGVALKLVLALGGPDREEALFSRYCTLAAVGTVADVMQMTGENRTIVSRGLATLDRSDFIGLHALLKEAGLAGREISSVQIGFVLAPRINAAGRMGQIDLAVELFLTDDPDKAAEAARGLCELNRQRQAVESEIYRQAVSMLPMGKPPEAIVLADGSWHQGVVGIVASRIAEEYACPTFLICLDGEHGKASSRSHGGFNLFASLSALSPLLESYGGHELAAGFTISRANIPEFRRQICALAAQYYTDDVPRTVLDVDCAVSPELLTLHNVDSLQMLEPCGNGCPKPVLMMKNLTIDRISMVGGGRHMRLRLCSGHTYLNAIYFSANPQTVSIQPGDLVDVAFTPQVNEFRGTRTVQMNVIDIRPSCSAECLPDAAPYRDMQRGNLTSGEAAALLPDRKMLALVWRYLDAANPVQESPMCLCRKIVRWSGQPLNLGQMLTCLDIFRDVGLLTVQRQHKYVSIRLTPGEGKADLSRSQTMQRLLHAKES